MIIKKPTKARPIFRLMERQNKRYITINSTELDAINLDMKEGRLTADRALQLVEELKRKLTKPKPVSWLPENMEIVEEYWKEIGSQKEGLRRPEEAHRRLLYAIKQIGSTSIITSSANEIREAMRHVTDPDNRRRVMNVINSLCKFKGINKWLRPPKGKKPSPEFITLPELHEVLKHITNEEYRLCCYSAFATGCRYGELYDLSLTSYRSNGTHVFIDGQRQKDWVKIPTKNDERGTVFIVPELRDKLRSWIEVPTPLKMITRRIDGEGFKAACFKALGRPLTFHNLRHSYAKHMLGRGATLEDLRKWLRDRLSTVERYYISWVETDSEMQNNLRRFG